mgnify:CR=1 FL=1
MERIYDVNRYAILPYADYKHIVNYTLVEPRVWIWIRADGYRPELEIHGDKKILDKLEESAKERFIDVTAIVQHGLHKTYEKIKDFWFKYILEEVGIKIPLYRCDFAYRYIIQKTKKKTIFDGYWRNTVATLCGMRRRIVIVLYKEDQYRELVKKIIKEHKEGKELIDCGDDLVCKTLVNIARSIERLEFNMRLRRRKFKTVLVTDRGKIYWNKYTIEPRDTLVKVVKEWLKK